MVEAILGQYGMALTLERDGESVTFRGIFQPLLSKSWQSIENLATPIGELPRAQYVCVCPGGTAAQEGDTLTAGGKRYCLRRVEPYYYGEEIAYVWGLCVEKGESEA